MDWLRQAAAQLREWLTRQVWLDGWQSSIAHTPDWALLATGPATLLLFALLLRIAWPRSRTSDTYTKPQAQTQSRHEASANVAPATATTKSPPTPIPARKSLADQSAALGAPAQMADDDEDSRSVRVFVSSTFLDMQTERDELVTKTFPALRAKYRARGVEVFEVDLRWGITREQQERGETLPTLLGEIDRCRPYFIGLLGDRYGWVPPSEALTEKLKADFPVLADAEGVSVTAMEIMHGVLANPDTAARAIFFERDSNWDWRATLNDADRAIAGEEPEAARAKREDLKAQIRQKAQVETYARPEEIGAKVTAALDALLEARFPEAETPDVFEQTARLHRAYARERRGLHVGAKGYVNDLNRWMDTKDAAPLLITGPSGGGKSTLVANWLHSWRKEQSSGIVFEHYLGASPDSAEPMLIMQRLWEYLNRATGENVALPGDNADLMDLSAALAERLAQARVSPARGDSRILIALDGLDKLSSEQNLRWLPITPGVHWLVSSLPGYAETAARARGFVPLDVQPLNEQERRDFIVGTLARWRRELEPQHIARILQPAAAELAGSPLYLKTVLEELRVSADNARLTERLEDYRGAHDMANLFDRVLTRLEDDCEPGLVAKALPLIWASRAGLEEIEILAITGASPLAWATLRNGLGDGLRDSQGRLLFGHDFLSEAVAARYLGTDEQQRAAHLSIADRFEARVSDARQAEELPFQLRAAEAWERLEALLVDFSRFTLLRHRGDLELLAFWLPLKKRGRDLEALLHEAFAVSAGDTAHWGPAQVDLAITLDEFLDFAGAVGPERQRLCESTSSACERLLGPEHRETLLTLSNLAATLKARGNLGDAKRCEERVLNAAKRTLGIEHPDTLIAASNLALTLSCLGDFEGAQSLQENVLDAHERVLGPEHLSTLTSMNNLGSTLRERGDFDGAQRLLERVLERRTHSLGPEHPNTLIAMANLAETLQARGDSAGARALHERVLEARKRLLGPDHPLSLLSMDRVGQALFQLGDLKGAQAMQEQALEVMIRALGAEHPQALTTMGNLSQVLKARGDLANSRTLQERTLEVMVRVAGPEHPATLTHMGRLAAILAANGDPEGAQAMQKRVLEAMTRVLGPEHPDTVTSESHLAHSLYAHGDLEAAQAMQEHVLDVMMRVLGPEHPETLTSMNNLAETLKARGDFAGAQTLQERSLEGMIRVWGLKHDLTLITMNNLAHTFYARGNLDRARAMLEQVRDTRIDVLGLEHPDSLSTMHDLGRVLEVSGDLEGAQSMQKLVLEVRARVLGVKHPDTQAAAEALTATKKQQPH